MLKQNLYDIDLYARKSLDALERGVEVIPDWVHHKIAAARTHMKDVGHFMRHEAHMGRRYGSDKNGMCSGSLDNIAEYARLTSKSLQKGSGEVPEWVHSKVAVAADYMNCVGHYLEGRAKGESRAYSGTIDYPERGPAGIGGVAWTGPCERRYGVPGHPYGTPGWAGAGGVAQAMGPIRGSRNKRSRRQVPHAYGSLGYASMGDGSMDLATGGDE